MGGRMSKSELRKRGASRVHPADEALEEPLIDDYVHVAAPEEGEEGAAPAAARPDAATVAAAPPPASAAGAGLQGGAGLLPGARPGLAQQLSALWRSLLAACIRSWTYIRGALVWCLSSLGLAPAPPPRLSLVQRERLESLQERLAVPYDASSPTHQAALRSLWEVAFPGEGFPPGVKSERWKDMGWQSDDPGRDFRGAGIIPLDCLLHMAEREEATFRQLMLKEAGVRNEWEYPFAAGGVNLAYMLSEVLDLRHVGSLPASPAGRAFLPLLDETDTAFEELFVGAYRLLDRTWLGMGASYMEFPLVIKAVRQRVQQALGRRVASMEELLLRLEAVAV